MKYISFVFLVFLGFNFSSCFYGSFKGLKNDFDKISITNKNRVVFGNQMIDNKDENRIFSMSGNEFENLIAKENKVLLYVWSPTCSNESCLPLAKVEKYAKANNMSLYIFLEYFDFKRTDIELPLSNPFITANHIFYKTVKVNKLLNLFFKDLLKKEKLSKDEKFARYFLFESGSLKTIKYNL